MREQIILSKWFNANVFATEFSIVLGMVLFVFLWALAVKIFKYKRVALVNSFGFALSFLIAAVIPWGTSRIIYPEGLTTFINPISVLTQSILRASKHVPKFGLGIAYQGIFYIIGAQLLGAIAGYVLFTGIFYFIKSTKNHETLNEVNSVMDLLKFTDALTIRKNIIKEIFFIGLFATTLSWLPFINPAQFGSNHFWVILVSTIIVFALIFMSSPFNGFAFHLAFPLLSGIDAIINLIKNKIKDKKSIDKTVDFEAKKQHKYKILYACTNLGYTSAITVIFSLVVPIIMILIGHKNNVSHNL